MFLPITDTYPPYARTNNVIRKQCTDTAANSVSSFEQKFHFHIPAFYLSLSSFPHLMKGLAML